MNPSYSQISEDYDNISSQLHDDDSLDNSTIASAYDLDEDDRYAGHHHEPPSRKRKRDQEHMLYAYELLD